MIFRKAILIVHGFAGGSYDHEALFNELQIFLDFDVYSFTLPGHEKAIMLNSKKEDWIKSAENQMERLIKRGYHKIYVVGHSMGGVIAAHLARKYKQVKKIVFIAPAFHYLVFKNNKLQVLPSLLKLPSVSEGYDKSIVVSRLLKMPISALRAFMSLVKEHQDDPKHIKCDALIIQGKADKLVPMDSSEYVYKSLKSKTKILFKVKDVNHEVLKSKRKDEVIDIIIKFLRKRNRNIQEIIDI